MDDSVKQPEECCEPPLIFASRPERIAEALFDLGWYSPIDVEDLKQNRDEWEERALAAEAKLSQGDTK